MLLEGRSRNINARRRRKIISILILYRIRTLGYCDVYKGTIFKRASPEVKCLHPTSSRHEMRTSSFSNMIYHKLSHGAAFYTLSGKNVNVMLEFFIFLNENLLQLSLEPPQQDGNHFCCILVYTFQTTEDILSKFGTSLKHYQTIYRAQEL